MLEGQGNTGLQEKVRAHSQSCDWYPKHYHGNRQVEQALHLKPYTLGSSTAADQKLKVQLIQALCRLNILVSSDALHPAEQTRAVDIGFECLERL